MPTLGRFCVAPSTGWSVSPYQLGARFARFAPLTLQQRNGEGLGPFETLSLKVNQTTLVFRWVPAVQS